MSVLIKYTVMVSVILLILGVGMGTSCRQIVDAVRQFGVILRGVLVNFLVTPILLSLPPDITI